MKIIKKTIAILILITLYFCLLYIIGGVTAIPIGVIILIVARIILWSVDIISGL